MSKLLEKILDKENIDLAIRQVKANKGSPGIDGMKVDEVEDYLREHGEELYGRIRKRKYKPLPVRRVETSRIRSKAARKVARMPAMASSQVQSQAGSKWVFPIIYRVFIG